MTAGSRFVIDSSAWIEYLEGSHQGKKAAKIIEGEAHIIITPKVVMAEVYSKTLRSGGDPEKARSIIEDYSAQFDEDNETYFLAGRLHAELKKKFKDMSLADAVVMAVAKKNDAKIVTKDFHLKGGDAIYIG